VSENNSRSAGGYSDGKDELGLGLLYKLYV